MAKVDVYSEVRAMAAEFNWDEAETLNTMLAVIDTILDDGPTIAIDDMLELMRDTEAASRALRID
jgi:hypothetical protein